MGVAGGDGWERIFRGKVIQEIPKDEDFPNQYIIDAEEIVIVCDRYHPPLQEKGKILTYEKAIGRYSEWGFDKAKSCMNVMNVWRDVISYDWTPKNKDFYWKLYDLALYNLGLLHTSTEIRQFQSDRLKEEENKRLTAKMK